MDALKPAVDAVIDELACCICLNPCTDPVALTCGHIGCSGCIAEWLTRKPECPLCKRTVPRDPSACVKVHVLDSVLAKLLELNRAVDALRTDAALAGSARPAAGGSDDDPIASLFKTHVREAIETCATYVRQLRSERDAVLLAAQRDVTAAIARNDGTEGQARALADAASSRASTRYATAYASLQRDVETYLASAAVPVSLIPATVTVSVPSVGVRVDVRLRPMDTIADVVEAHVRRVVADTLHADVVVFPPDAVWQCTSPALAAPVTLRADAPLFAQFAGARPPPAAIITCAGAVAATSSRASKCLSEVWTPGTKEDFFWCTSCALKWVCSSCAEACHRAKGHAVSPFLKQHAATFACCYCKTRGKCTLASAAAGASTSPASATGGAAAGAAPPSSEATAAAAIPA